MKFLERGFLSKNTSNAIEHHHYGIFAFFSVDKMLVSLPLFRNRPAFLGKYTKTIQISPSFKQNAILNFKERPEISSLSIWSLFKLQMLDVRKRIYNENIGLAGDDMIVQDRRITDYDNARMT